MVSDDDDGTGGKAKASKPKRAPAPFVDAVIAELSSKRKLTVGKFNGSATIGIREARAPSLHDFSTPVVPELTRALRAQFYEKDGQMLPGAKGISLTAEQWKILVDAAPAVDAALADLK